MIAGLEVATCVEVEFDMGVLFLLGGVVVGASFDSERSNIFSNDSSMFDKVSYT